MNTKKATNCYICGQKATETHHIRLGNCTRKKCEEYPDILTVRLCRMCHRRLHDSDKTSLQIDAQTKLEKIMSHEEYMKIFKKSYK